ncbi:N-acetylglucosamine kinase [Actinacidiphila bryophytorum]|uniref:N-acetylglucosamine kinase euakryotic type n=1 Tax=Actinacidiphila bryophytorum TaxID=1436133 RepID=A0A9W4GZU3_9ACTN|nr:BadF/BadG/BcrA/BcrD ATPase family protein [Actinacidiphila bryophytorum]MBM9439342.1 ATPase [Actinacidiphila bryophytorum]MBN6545773.1 ATPase [Actinacidiphila bryophytorum]CAG7618761.1 N-acetylglucosamine kinase euakryotic type [Actinacidiphila bryophytorum]
MPGTTHWVLGVDSGGSGVRVAITRADGSGGPGAVADDRPVPTGERGIDAAALLDRVLPRVAGLLREVAADSLAAACVGAAGMASLGDDLRAALPAALEDAFGVRALALAGDAVTAYAGALGLSPGVVVAAGTGLIALGTSGESWRRADGWGHLLGDAGGGAWIGRAGLEAAMRAHDGRAGGSAALLARAQQRFGPAGAMPSVVYPRTDRPAVLASFAPDVAQCAAQDPVASEILRQAAQHILESAAAARPQLPGETRVGLAGGLFKMGEPLLGPLRDQAEWLLPDAVLVPAAGDPLDGALLIARALHEDRLTLPVDGVLLHAVRR